MVAQLQFEAVKNNKKYKIELICNNKIYNIEFEIDYILSFYYLVFLKIYLKDKNIQKLASVV